MTKSGISLEDGSIGNRAGAARDDLRQFVECVQISAAEIN